MTPEWARRFYGMPVAYDVVRAAAGEQLTDRTIEDVVDAHLVINYGYFGAIDKTLSGFVVLDSTGDDFTLLDVRDGGQVWWQDHETRELELRHDSLAAYLSRADGQAETPKLAPRASRAITTPTLCARYQWLVWMLARPLERDGRAMQEIEYLVRSGLGRLRHVWPRRDALDAAFVVADHARRLRLLAASGDRAPDLVQAFVSRLGALPLAGDLPVVPGFRARRALAQTYGETELFPDDIPRVCLLALELDPTTSSLVHALQISTGLERGVLAAADVAAVMARIPEATPGVELVRAVLAKRGGAKASPRAAALARLLPAAPDPRWCALEALWQ